MKSIAVVLAIALMVGTMGCTATPARTSAPSVARRARTDGSPNGTEAADAGAASSPRKKSAPATETFLSLAQAQAKVPFTIHLLKDPSGLALRDFVVFGLHGRPAVKMRNANFDLAQIHEETTKTAATAMLEAVPRTADPTKMVFDSRYMVKVRIAGAEAISWDATSGVNMSVPFSGIVFHVGPDWYGALSSDGKIPRARLVMMAQELANSVAGVQRREP
jgi:hypothetical protein